MGTRQADRKPTGTASAVGDAIAEVYAGEGAQLMLAHVDADRLAAAEERYDAVTGLFRHPLAPHLTTALPAYGVKWGDGAESSRVARW